MLENLYEFLYFLVNILGNNGNYFYRKNVAIKNLLKVLFSYSYPKFPEFQYRPINFQIANNSHNKKFHKIKLQSFSLKIRQNINLFGINQAHLVSYQGIKYKTHTYDQQVSLNSGVGFYSGNTIWGSLKEKPVLVESSLKQDGRKIQNSAHLVKGGNFLNVLFLIKYTKSFMSLQQEGFDQKLVPAEVQKLQKQALKRVKNLKRRPKSSLKKSQENHIGNKSYQKMMMVTPQKKYSIEKVHQKNQIEFITHIMQSKQLTRKMSAKIKLQKYSFQHIIGCGMFGKVWKAEDRSTHKLYAIKQIAKSLVIVKKGLGAVLNQRQIITQLHYHLIPNLITSFQTELYLYLMLPLMEKGDLRYHITKFKYFSEKQVRFFIACVVAVLEYLRKSGIIHRDIKPENLLLDQSGYLHLSDFGVAQKFSEVLQGNCCGTPAYMAPEVIFEKEYTYTADYYALGVLLYEMMTGQRPYITSNRQQLRHLMSKHSAHIKKDQIPEGWSIQSADFANKLLHRNPTNRLGHTDINQIKNHPWLKGFPWQKLQRRELVSPYCQPFNHWQVDYKQLFVIKNKEEIKETQNLLQKGQLQELFQCFTYDNFQKSMEYTTKPSSQLKL